MAKSSDDPPAHNPHDGLVKHVFTNRKAAEAELRQVLPAELVERLDFSTLKVASSSFVDAELRHRVSDILYTIGLKDSAQEVLVYVLMEHQSSPDALMAARFLVYLGRLYEQHLRKKHGMKTVPLVIPLLLYQGPGGWTWPRRLSDLIDAPADTVDKVGWPVELEFLVDDLGTSAIAERVTRDQLRRNHGLALAEMARTMLWLYRHPEAANGVRAARLNEVRDVIAETLGKDAVRPFFVYLFSAFAPQSPVSAIMMKSARQETDGMYETYREQWIAAAEAKGLAKGEATGATKGRAEMLEHLLQARGLKPTEAQQARIAECTDDSLLRRWFERAISATTLAEVFND